MLIQIVDEPKEYAWCVKGRRENSFVDFTPGDCESVECSNILRVIPQSHQRDGSIIENEEVPEHIAGPECESINGYNGNLIAARAMDQCKSSLHKCILNCSGR